MAGELQKATSQVTGVPKGSGTTTITDILQGNFGGGNLNLVNLAFFLIGFAFFISLSLAGIQYVNSGADPKKLSQINTRLINSFLGLAITIGAFLIVRITATLFGFGNTNIVPIQ